MKRKRATSMPTITVSELRRGCRTFEKNESRDSMYRVATFLLQQTDWWGDRSRVADALAVLLLCWNASFYRYSGGRLDHRKLVMCLRKNWDAIERFHSKNIFELSTDNAPAIKALFNSLLRALGITTSNGRTQRMSPVAVAKALHLLAPEFFPIWDHTIARAYGCNLHAKPCGCLPLVLRQDQRSGKRSQRSSSC